jgi:hypothetical protein
MNVMLRQSNFIESVLTVLVNKYLVLTNVMTGRQRKATHTMTCTRKMEMLQITAAVCLEHLRLESYTGIPFLKIQKPGHIKTLRRWGVEDKYFNLSCNGKSRII